MEPTHEEAVMDDVEKHEHHLGSLGQAAPELNSYTWGFDYVKSQQITSLFFPSTKFKFTFYHLQPKVLTKIGNYH